MASLGGIKGTFAKLGSKFARKKAAGAAAPEAPPPIPPAAETPPAAPKEKKPSRLRRFFGKAREKAPVAGAVAAGATLAAGAAVYGGSRSVLGAGWRLSRSLLSAVNIMFLFAVALHLYDLVIVNNFGTGGLYASTSRPMIYLTFAIIAWLFLYNHRGDGLGDTRALVPPLLLSAIAMIAPFLLFNQFTLSFIKVKTTLTFIFVLVPVWPVSMMFGFFGLPTTRFTRTVRAVYIIILLLAFLPTMWYSISQDFNVQSMRVGTLGVLYDVVDNAKEGIKQLYKSTVEVVTSLPKIFRGKVDQQIQYAVGDQYTGQVEQGKNKPTGVYLDNVEPTATEFNADDIVTVWATLLARTLDPDKEITVTASCYGQKMEGTELKKEKGDADPMSDSKDFVIKTRTEEERYISCEFPPLFFDKGPKSIFVDAEFNFESMSYIKAYFMNLETLRTMRREGIDPLDQYKITDKKPTAVYTNGPVALGMKTSDVPIGVSASEPVDIKLGVTLDNAWPQGMINKVNSIVIKIPEQMEITYCDHTFEKVACSGDECENGQYTVVYKIKKSSEGGRMGLDGIKNVAGYHSIVCRLKINNIDALMGNYPIVSRYFKVTTEYVYGMEKSTGVLIKEALSNTIKAPTTTQKPKQISFSYRPTSSSVTVKVNAQKDFSVTITNPGKISYGWESKGIKEEVYPDATSYTFSSDKAGQATVTFRAIDEKGNKVEERKWDVNVVE